jgi:hypothetical protein
VAWATRQLQRDFNDIRVRSFIPTGAPPTRLAMQKLFSRLAFNCRRLSLVSYPPATA